MNHSMQRWRLVLGHFAQKGLGVSLDSKAQRMEQALDFLYGREYQGRGVRPSAGTLDPSQLTVPTWLHAVRELFPNETAEVIEKHALDRYGLTELITDKQVLEKMEPNLDLLKALLTFRGLLKGDVLHEARRIVRHVVEEIKRKLYADVRRALAGRVNRFQHSPMKSAANLDWRKTVRVNLKNYDRERKKLGIQDVRFFSRIQHRMPWHIILCIDQSGSMTESVIHSAVMAGILAGLPMLRVKVVAFDTSIVDLTDFIDDPVEMLMSVQLGGGTDIGQAMTYCESLIEDPRRSIVVLVSDFCEGAPPGRLMGSVERLREGGVRLLGLAALGPDAHPSYDRQMAERLAAGGMDIAALTPKQLADWLARVVV